MVERKLDYEASIAKLVEKLRQMERADFDTTAQKKQLNDLSERLRIMADELASPKYCFLEEDFETPATGLDGWWAEDPESLKGSYGILLYELKKLSEIAGCHALGLPRKKPRFEPLKIRYAAAVYLHLNYIANSDPPSFYESSKEVLSFKVICERAGLVIDKSTAKNYLWAASLAFRWHEEPEGFLDILTYNQ